MPNLTEDNYFKYQIHYEMEAVCKRYLTYDEIKYILCVLNLPVTNITAGCTRH